MDNKYFRNIRLSLVSDNAEPTDFIDFGLKYDGGDVLPFYIQINEASTNLGLTASFNKVSNEMLFGFSVASKSDSQNIAASGELKLTPSEKPIDVDVPVGAKNISELLSMIGQVSALDSSDETNNNLEFNSL